MTFVSILEAGIIAVLTYLQSHVAACLLPAFFIAGAISALVPKESITRMLGAGASKWKAYPVAVAAGLLLAVCSCTILPLFAGIRKKGAGLGPGVTFLYTAPATNILAILFTGSVLGWQLAGARIIFSVAFAIIIGLILSSIFHEQKGSSNIHDQTAAKDPNVSFIRRHRVLLFVASLFAILFAGISKLDLMMKLSILLILIALVLLQLRLFSRDERRRWLQETWMFFRMIFPLLLLGIFVAGVLGALLPAKLLASYVGDNSVLANFIAVLFGTVMYFPTLIEVPMAQLFLSLGMASGPLLAYLLADPVISLPSLLVVRKLMGNRQTLVYAGLIIVFSTIAGLSYGLLRG
ncbi:MAG: permease [Nanoarchaeota archaeon]